MDSNNYIPQKVSRAFESLIAMYGNRVEFIGNRDEVNYYMFRFPENTETGFPIVIAYKSGNVSDITDFDAVDIVASFYSED